MYDRDVDTKKKYMIVQMLLDKGGFVTRPFDDPYGTVLPSKGKVSAKVKAGIKGAFVRYLYSLEPSGGHDDIYDCSVCKLETSCAKLGFNTSAAGRVLRYSLAMLWMFR